MADCDSINVDERPRVRAGPSSAFVDLHPALSEANHRISNNLALLASSISMRASRIARHPHEMDGDEVAALLYETSARIVTVGQLHRLLSKHPQAARLDLKKSLRELCETLVSTLSGPERTELIWTATGECGVATAHALPICLIVTETVTNSLKYAHPSGVKGLLLVGCYREPDGSLVVEVADDGVGLPEGFDLKADGGIGSRTVHLLAQQIGAEVRFASPPIGLSFRLRLPAGA